MSGFVMHFSNFNYTLFGAEQVEEEISMDLNV